MQSRSGVRGSSFLVLLTSTFLVACSPSPTLSTSSSGAGGSGGASSGSSTNGGTGGTAPTSSASSGGAGPGEISGQVGGKPFSQVASAYWIGQSDDPKNTIVVYVFDQPVACAEIGAAGWDQVITDKTASLEMKLIGTMPGTYPVATGANPMTGEAAVFYTLTSTSGTPAEKVSKGGTVVLGSLSADKEAGGSFDVTFPDGQLKGQFAAAWCPGGHEP